MKKIALSIILIFSLLIGIAYARSFNRIIYPIKTTDATEYLLVQKNAPERIICASPSVAEILYELNLQDKIVGLTDNCDYPDDAKKVPKIGRDSIDIAKLLKLQPDIVIVEKNDNKINIEDLRKLKFNIVISGETIEQTVEVFAVNPVSLSDIINNIYTIGTIMNKDHSAYSLNQKFGRKLEWAGARAKNSKDYLHYKALVVTSKRPITVAGRGTYLNDIMKMAGLRDVSKIDNDLYVRMNRKEIEAADPDIIITSTSIARNPKDIYNNRDFRKTSAGRNKRVICIDEKVFNRFGPRTAEILEQVGSFTYGWSQNDIEQSK